jgi:hypothetical protein
MPPAVARQKDELDLTHAPAHQHIRRCAPGRIDRLLAAILQPVYIVEAGPAYYSERPFGHIMS